MIQFHVYESLSRPSTQPAAVPERVDRADGSRSGFAARVLDVVRQETFGLEIGQTGWLTEDEFLTWFRLSVRSFVTGAASAERDIELQITQ